MMDKVLTEILRCDSCYHKQGCEDLPSQKNRCDRYRKEEDPDRKADMSIGFDSDNGSEFDHYHYVAFLD